LAKQRERNVVQMEAAVSGEGVLRDVTTQKRLQGRLEECLIIFNFSTNCADFEELCGTVRDSPDCAEPHPCILSEALIMVRAWDEWNSFPVSNLCLQHGGTLIYIALSFGIYCCALVLIAVFLTWTWIVFCSYGPVYCSNCHCSFFDIQHKFWKYLLIYRVPSFYL
jgi:hypothetical protein